MQKNIDDNEKNLNTLIRIQKIQSLLKKESAIKELCKKKYYYIFNII